MGKTDLFVTNIELFVNGKLRSKFIEALNEAENLCSTIYKSSRPTLSIDIRDIRDLDTITSAIYAHKPAILDGTHDKNFKVISIEDDHIAYIVTLDGIIKVLQLNDLESSDTYHKAVFVYQVPKYRSEFLYEMLT